VQDADQDKEEKESQGNHPHNKSKIDAGFKRSGQLIAQSHFDS
jgi:hypothetical protein